MGDIPERRWCSVGGDIMVLVSFKISESKK
jgi:hypothetical protein